MSKLTVQSMTESEREEISMFDLKIIMTRMISEIKEE
jgi:hypothetical protein